MAIQLYGYWRSSAAYRVRIALNLKQLDYEHHSVHLIKEGGEQHTARYQALNPSELVPVLVDGDVVLNQSLAIIDYLDEVYPQHLVTPSRKKDRYLVKALAQDIAVDIHPLNNLRVLQFLTDDFEVTEAQKMAWYHHWIALGFHALEKKLVSTSGMYSVGNQITLVDVCLVPQVYNALRFNVDMSSFPIISRIYEALSSHPAFIKAAPENQPDAN
ncbi:maleylacetoacetate isomerase [Vibrio sp. NTOU-M3]|uniref:maleylacetoacetate isomerase n=1 Tax=Vibrio sp. NTOU-M3 TaxID=3234954 RepID=UPI00349F2A13